MLILSRRLPGRASLGGSGRGAVVVVAGIVDSPHRKRAGEESICQAADTIFFSADGSTQAGGALFVSLYFSGRGLLPLGGGDITRSAKVFTGTGLSDSLEGDWCSMGHLNTRGDVLPLLLPLVRPLAAQPPTRRRALQGGRGRRKECRSESPFIAVLTADRGNKR